MYNPGYTDLKKVVKLFSVLFSLSIIGCSPIKQITALIKNYEEAINTTKTYEDRLVKIKPYIDESTINTIKFAHDGYNNTKDTFEKLPVMGVPNFNKIMIDEISNSEVILSIGKIQIENDIASANVYIGLKINKHEYELGQDTILLKRKNRRWVIFKPPVYKLDPLTDIEKLYIYVLASKG